MDISPIGQFVSDLFLLNCVPLRIKGDENTTF